MTGHSSLFDETGVRSTSAGDTVRVVPDYWPNEEFLTVAEVAALLRLNQQTIRNWIDQRSLPARPAAGRGVCGSNSAISTDS